MSIKHNGHYRTLRTPTQVFMGCAQRPIITLMFNCLAACGIALLISDASIGFPAIFDLHLQRETNGLVQGRRMSATTPVRSIPGLNSHTLLQLLGEGGMGQVFLARNNRTGEMTVVKTIHDHLLKDTQVRHRFHQEIDLMNRFQHPNAVRLLQQSPPSAPIPFFIMEFVRGITLDELSRQQQRLSPLRTGCFLAPLCLFLQAAHDNGLLHRDLTPANIMVTDANTPQENIKVMDFGLARRIGFYIPAGQLQDDNGAIDGGTPDYVCPEQILGRRVDNRGDLFSVGVLLYVLLTGHLPQEALSDPIEILGANVHVEPPCFNSWSVYDVPPAIEKLVLRCMSKNPSGRPPTARALIEEYQHILGHHFVDDQAFEESESMAISSLLEEKQFDPRSVIDQFEANLVEQVAAMKLRGFTQDVGGLVAESEAGVIKFQLPRTVEVAVKKTIWSWFKASFEKRIEWLSLEMHIVKKKDAIRDTVDITVVRPLPADETVEQARIRKLFCDAYCAELRAYLMVGR
jgi:eukaryotic-like serine/threonine-protein kinase